MDDEVSDRAAMGTISELSVDGGLPAPEIDVPEIDGERE